MTIEINCNFTVIIYTPLEPKHKLILIADDDRDDQELLEEAFHDVDSGVKADKVWNGKEALDYLEKCTTGNMPCAILLDYSMPLMNGAQVLAVICNDSRFQSIPKFVWSTSDSKIHIRECMGNGAINYFVKPDSPGKLRDLAKEILASCDN